MMLKSQNGWPASADRSVVNIQTFEVPLSQGTLKIPLRGEAAPRLIEMIRWWDANIEPVTVGKNLGTWGYAFRTVRGVTTTLSNHASGTAIDINAPKHPLGSRNTVQADKVAAMQAKAAELGLRWGGDYKGRADEMHFEVITSPSPEVVAYSEKRSQGIAAAVPQAAELVTAAAKGAAREVIGGGRKELRAKLRRNWWIVGLGLLAVSGLAWLALRKPKQKTLTTVTPSANPRRRRRKVRR